MSSVRTNALLVLATLIVAAFLISFTLLDENQFAVALVVSLALLITWLLWQLVGVRAVEKDTVVLLGGDHGKPTVHTRGTYVFIPLLNAVQAVMPAYTLRREFEIEAIDTQTPRLGRISRIRVRVAYRITNFELCYGKAKGLLERIIQIEAETKLRRDEPEFWRKLLNELMAGAVDDYVRDVVWRWADHIANDPGLALRAGPGLATVPEPQHDPYALSLNRHNVARKVTMELGARLQREWGITLEPLVFEAIEIDPELVKIKTRNRVGEVDDARHASAKEAAAIRERGEAEAYVRSHSVAMLLDVLLNQYDIPFTDPLVQHVVRAALYSDGEMLWTGVLAKGEGSAGPAKAA